LHQSIENIDDVFSAGLISEFFQRSLVEHFALVQQTESIAKPFCLVQSVGRNQDGFLFASEMTDEFENGTRSKNV
jgi:hypothetical protein